jgi:glyoxylase-like metal-dependent hydrolase (beta-lactamase superfamily II)
MSILVHKPDPSRRTRFAAVAMLLLVCAWALADSSVTKERSVTKVAEGVYVIRHKDSPDAFPQGNTTVIIGERDVLVVDACYLPSSAREDIAQIKQWTSKPVRYLVNTHWHVDHTMGNGVYAEEFPSITIIAQSETAQRIKDYNPGWFKRFPNRVTVFKNILDSGKDQNGRLLTATDRKDYETAMAGLKPVQDEYAKLIDRAPDMTFDRELNIDLGKREVQIKHLGRGNTAGDAVIVLPTERIAITGDLLTPPVPYLGSGYPSELTETLKHLSDLPVDLFIPGHGDALRDRVFLNDVSEFVRIVVSQVHLELNRIGPSSTKLQQVQEGVEKAIDVEAWRMKFCGNSVDDRSLFDSFSFPELVKTAYQEAWKR